MSRIGPPILWIGALLASLLGSTGCSPDREDGSLDLMLMQERRWFDGLRQCLAHWLSHSLPLVIASPLLALFMNMDALSVGATALTLLVGRPRSPLSVRRCGGRRLAAARGLLVSILVLPLTIPVLIFGAGRPMRRHRTPHPSCRLFSI